jgi:hypothetical protein
MIRQYAPLYKAYGACSWYVYLLKLRNDSISARYEVFHSGTGEDTSFLGSYNLYTDKYY